MLLKIEKSLFLLLLFSIPFQTRVFLWSSEFVEGFNEWQSIFLYGTDLIIFALFLLFFIRTVIKKNNKVGNFLKGVKNRPLFILYAAIFFLIFLAFVSIFSANFKIIAAYRYLKLIEFVLLFFYTSQIMRYIKFSKAAFVIVISAVFQSIIAVTQFFIQGSLGLKLLGESPLEAGQDNVAEFVAFGSRFVRAYGTFPSPNVLASFLGLSVLFLISWHLSQQAVSHKEKLFTWQALGLISFALFLTFSRAPMAALSVIFVFYLFSFSRKQAAEYRKKLFNVIAPLALTLTAIAVIFWPEVYSRIFTTFARGDSALKERVFFNNLSFQIISENFSGIGIGNYTLFLREHFWGLKEGLYQPVHNIFLLYFSELGLFGGAAFLVFCATIALLGIKAFRRKPEPVLGALLFGFLFILLSGFFDHFYLTLQQGALMFWVTAGMLYNKINLNYATGS